MPATNLSTLFITTPYIYRALRQIPHRVVQPPKVFRNSPYRSISVMNAAADKRHETMSQTDIGVDIAANLEAVRSTIASVVSSYREEADVQLVAVSKTKPVELLMAAYQAEQRHFGENYVQELVTKAPQMPADIKWHFIGSLQSNKAKVLVGVDNLYMVETVDRQKTAAALDKALVAVGREQPLKIMVQVNTSGEKSKSGCEPGETVDLAEYVDKECEHLELVGLMTIGAFDVSEEPEAFKILGKEREAVAEVLGRETESLKLSMGMSADFEAAIRMGSDSVRVGSTIFGARNYARKT